MPERWIAREHGGPDTLTLETFERADPGLDQVVIEVKAAGINPIDLKRLAGAGAPLVGAPLTFGFEVAGVIAAISDGVSIQTGSARVGDPVVAFQLTDGYSTEVSTAAANVFAMPPRLSFPETANLLLVASTASELLHRSRATSADVILVHGGSGSVGSSVVQQAKLFGAKVIATSGPAGFERLIAHGAIPVQYGPGLEDRIRALAPEGIDVALDTAGSDEAVQTSISLVANRARIVTIVARAAAQKYGFLYVGGDVPGSVEYRMSVRGHLLELAGAGRLTVHVARTFAFSDAPGALSFLGNGHPGGKLALVT